ncbi:MAG: hypothetical protein QXW40_03545 [Thermofilum sp.]
MKPRWRLPASKRSPSGSVVLASGLASSSKRSFGFEGRSGRAYAGTISWWARALPRSGNRENCWEREAIG